MNAFLKDRAAALRVLWLCVAGAIAIGVFTIWEPGISQVDAIRSQGHELQQQIDANDSALHQVGKLRSAKLRVEHEIAVLGGASSNGLPSSQLLRLLDTERRERHIEVRSVLPQSSLPSVSQQQSLVAETVALNVRGHFGDILNFVADLPRRDVLVEVTDAQMESRDMSAELDVTLHTAVYRIKNIARREGAHAAT